MKNIMRLPCVGSFALAVFATLFGTATPANAGWNNVFQVCCKDCGSRTRSSFSAPAPAEPCPSPCPEPQPEARVSFVERTVCQPTTVMERRSYKVPVTENVRSSYYEPVTTLRYTSYYDSCSGQCQQVAVPQTSYRLREQCNAVTRWVEKCYNVPVTVNKQVTMYTPVVTYYYPPVASQSSFKIPSAPPIAAPRVDELRQPSQMPDKAPGSDLIDPQGLPATPNSAPRVMPPATKPTGVSAYNTSRQSGMRGEIVSNDQVTPKGNTKLVFVSAADTSVREYSRTNEFGEFQVNLPAGDWYVYMGQGNGRAVYYKKITIAAQNLREVLLVSR